MHLFGCHSVTFLLLNRYCLFNELISHFVFLVEGDFIHVYPLDALFFALLRFLFILTLDFFLEQLIGDSLEQVRRHIVRCHLVLHALHVII